MNTSLARRAIYNSRDNLLDNNEIINENYIINYQSTVNYNKNYQTILNCDKDSGFGRVGGRKREKMAPPEDKYKLVCIGFAILGLTTLLPWNFYITATDYWMYKFRNISLTHTLNTASGALQKTDLLHLNDSQLINDDSTTSAEQRTPLQKFFESYLAIAANIATLTTMIINSIYGQRIPQKIRLYVSLTMMLIIFSLTTLFVKINTDNYQDLFFTITMIMVVIVSASSALFQAALFGIVASFPNNCMLTMVNGQAIAGLLAVLVQILTMINDSGPIVSGLWYFFTSTIFIACAIICYWLMDNEYTRYYLVISPRESLESDSNRDIDISSSMNNLLDSKSELIETIKECWQLALSVVLAFWISLSVFPAVCVLILPQHPNTSIFTGRFYIPITTFILFNFGDLCGRVCSAYVPFPNSKKNTLLALSTSRIIFPVLMLFCNVQPRNHTSVWFANDIFYPVFNTLSALTNGYLFSSAMVMASSNSSRERLELTGFIMATALGTGLLLGSLTSTILLRLI